MAGWHHRLNDHEFEQALGLGGGQGSLVCCRPWGCKELDTTEQPNWTDETEIQREHHMHTAAESARQTLRNAKDGWPRQEARRAAWARRSPGTLRGHQPRWCPDATLLGSGTGGTSVAVNHPVYAVCCSSPWKLRLIKHNRPSQHKALCSEDKTVTATYELMGSYLWTPYIGTTSARLITFCVSYRRNMLKRTSPP